MDYRGLQIFVAHPLKDIRENLVRSLRHLEFETFGIGELDPVLLDRRRDSILFLFIAIREDWDWRLFADTLLGDKNPPPLVALGTDDTPEGFAASIPESGVQAVAGMERYLKSIDARGHRHYVRFGTHNASIATFGFYRDGARYAGIVHDISVAGISCTFRPEPPSMSDRRVKELQLNLPLNRLVVSGRFTTYRMVAGQKVHVFLFDRSVSDEIQDSIYEFIYSSLEMKLSLR